MLPGYSEHMMGYVGRLAGRSMNKIEVVKPRTVSIFEPQSPEGCFISKGSPIGEVREDASRPEAREEKTSIPLSRSILKRGQRPQVDTLQEAGEDEEEYESLENSPDRSFSQPSANSSSMMEPNEPSIRTLRSNSIFQQEVQPAISPERMSEAHLSGVNSSWGPVRESSVRACEEKSNKPSIRTLKSNSIFQQAVQPAISPERMSEAHLSGVNSSWGPVRESSVPACEEKSNEPSNRTLRSNSIFQQAVQPGAILSMPKVKPEVVPQLKTGSAIEKTSQSEHVLRLLASKLPIHDERNEAISPDVEPERRKISAPLRTKLIQSSKDGSFGSPAFAHRSSHPESDPVIHVTIGRIEVRASQKPRLQEKRNNIGSIMSLEEYLGRPRGRG